MRALAAHLLRRAQADCRQSRPPRTRRLRRGGSGGLHWWWRQDGGPWSVAVARTAWMTR